MTPQRAEYPAPYEYDPSIALERAIKGNVVVINRTGVKGSVGFSIRWHTGDDWQAHNIHLFRSEQHPTKKSLREWDRRARNIAADQQAELLGKHDPGKRRSAKISVLDALKRYSGWVWGDSLHSQVLRDRTARTRERVCLGFLDWLGEHFDNIRRMWQLSAKHIAAWREWRQAHEISDATFAIECSHLQSWLSWCDEFQRGWTNQKLTVLPKSARKLLDLDGKPHLHLTDNDVADMIQSQPDDFRKAAMFTLATTGLRQSELRGLEVEWWKPDKMLLVIPKVGQERTKKHARTIPIGPILARVLTTQADCKGPSSFLFGRDGGQQIGGTQINGWLRRHEGKPHDLRRWWRTALMDEGCPDAYAKKMMGHRLAGEENPYVNFRPEKGRKWVEKIEARLLSVLCDGPWE